MQYKTDQPTKAKIPRGVYKDTGSLLKCKPSVDLYDWIKVPVNTHPIHQLPQDSACALKKKEQEKQTYQNFQKKLTNLTQGKGHLFLKLFLATFRACFLAIVFPVYFFVYALPRRIFFQILPKVVKKIAGGVASFFVPLLPRISFKKPQWKFKKITFNFSFSNKKNKKFRHKKSWFTRTNWIKLKNKYSFNIRLNVNPFRSIKNFPNFKFKIRKPQIKLKKITLPKRWKVIFYNKLILLKKIILLKNLVNLKRFSLKIPRPFFSLKGKLPFFEWKYKFRKAKTNLKDLKRVFHFPLPFLSFQNRFIQYLNKIKIFVLRIKKWRFFIKKKKVHSKSTSYGLKEGGKEFIEALSEQLKEVLPNVMYKPLATIAFALFVMTKSMISLAYKMYGKLSALILQLRMLFKEISDLQKNVAKVQAALSPTIYWAKGKGKVIASKGNYLGKAILLPLRKVAFTLNLMLLWAEFLIIERYSEVKKLTIKILQTE